MIKKKKNLVRSPDEYTRYYGNFRGVDFSSDHTQVNERRFAYAVNMYKDYRSGEGSAIETIPGFRRRFEAPSYIDENGIVIHPKINGIHEFETINEDGERKQLVLVHAGTDLYRWDSYPLSVNVRQELSLVIPEDAFETKDVYVFDLTGSEFSDKTIAKVISITVNGIDYTNEAYYSFNADTHELTIYKAITNLVKEGQFFGVNYYESVLEREDRTDSSMRDAESIGFLFNNQAFIYDGVHYQCYDMNGNSAFGTGIYTPTCYKGIPVNPELVAEDFKGTYEIEPKNLLSNEFIHTYVADGAIADYPIYDDDFRFIAAIDVYDTRIYDAREQNPEPIFKVVDRDGGGKAIRFTQDYVPVSPGMKGFSEDYDGVKVTFYKGEDTRARHALTINKCTLYAAFDGRVFLSGNRSHPNTIWYCRTRYDTGQMDATYFGELDYVVDGVENAPITALIPVADTLAALKNHAQQDGTIYFHKRQETGSNVAPVTYPSERGLSGNGCLGAAVNFLDDPIFIGDGVKAIGQLSVRLERAVEHRSTLIDSKLVNLNLSEAKLAEWGGYLLLLVDGRIFMADSRQVWQSENGNLQYEWYYLEGIGVYEGQRHEYYYAPALPNTLPDKITVDNEDYEVALADSIFDFESRTSRNFINTPVTADYTETDGIPQIKTYTESNGATVFFALRDTWDGKTYDKAAGTPYTVKKAILCEDRGSYTGGEFKPAKVIVNINDNIFFGTTNGAVCSFNFDQRSADGTLPLSSYSFDNRTIYCGVATKMDNCDIPHLTKTTIKKSTVLKTKSMIASTAKVKIRTNKSGYKGIARLNSRLFGFDEIDFSDFSFATQDQTIFAIREKEKNWVEKQHWIYSDEYQRPFSIHYLAFRYKIGGRIKE